MAQAFPCSVRAQLWTTAPVRPPSHGWNVSSCTVNWAMRSSPPWSGKVLPWSHTRRREQAGSGKMESFLKAGTRLSFHQKPSPQPGDLDPLLWNVTSMRVGTYQATVSSRPSTQPRTQAAVSKYFSNEWNLGAWKHVPPMLKWCFHCAKIEKNYSEGNCVCFM